MESILSHLVFVFGCYVILFTMSCVLMLTYLINYVLTGKNKPKEYILCAANHYNNGIKYSYQPINIDIGFVICAHRHHVCIEIFAEIVGFPYDKKAIEIKRTEEQGFLTNTNRFVNRQEALIIARLADQVLDEKEVRSIGLHSEDLY